MINLRPRNIYPPSVEMKVHDMQHRSYETRYINYKKIVPHLWKDVCMRMCLAVNFQFLKKYYYALCLHSDAILVIFSIVKHGLCNVHIWLAASQLNNQCTYVIYGLIHELKLHILVQNQLLPSSYSVQLILQRLQYNNMMLLQLKNYLPMSICVFKNPSHSFPSSLRHSITDK